MSIYKPSLLDKFKDFVNGLKSNWDQYEDHVADFDAHLAESATENVHGLAGKVIAESGNNQNGYYVKFDDGTLIVYRLSVAVNATITDVQVFPYPSPFTSYIAGSANLHGTSASSNVSDFSKLVVATLATGWHLRMVSPGNNNALPVNLFAIGRWK